MGTLQRQTTGAAWSRSSELHAPVPRKAGYSFLKKHLWPGIQRCRNIAASCFSPIPFLSVLYRFRQDQPTSNLWSWKTNLRYHAGGGRLFEAIEVVDLPHFLQLRRDASVHSQDLSSNQRTQWKLVEGLTNLFVQLVVEFRLHLHTEIEGRCHVPCLVIAPQHRYRLWIVQLYSYLFHLLLKHTTEQVFPGRRSLCPHSRPGTHNYCN